ncbi:unnamed protein product [Adineta steineri]|uniref:Uncharacterized protein n=1 Tax=Adineta steineri TaxID=433720 RepID=A0A818T3K6_9BILA|nr:unnamed protein product [Adineta steineri]CAF3681571.1 unnamed protein product [Adineta steineri]
MGDENSRLISTTFNMASNEARDRLHTIMTHDMAEAIEQIGQTLEACSTKKARLLSRLDEVARAVDEVRNECGCIDTTIASKVLHLNKLATQIVQQMALVSIPDQLPPPEPLAPPIVEIDLSTVHDRLNGLDHMVNDLTKLILEKEETVLYVINKRPGGNGEIKTTVHSPIRPRGSGIRHDRQEQIHNQMTKLQKIVRNIQSEGRNSSKELHHHHDHHRLHLRHHQSRHSSQVLSTVDDEEDDSQTNGEHTNHHTHNDNEEEEEEEESRGSDQTTVGPCTLCLQERTEDITAQIPNGHHPITHSHYTDRSHSSVTTSGDGSASHTRGLGEALASNGTDILYYDYEKELIRIAGEDDCSVKFQHGLVVDLYWWALNREWLILSEQGLYRWKAGESDYQDAYEFSNGEIGFRRIAVTSTSIFCLFRYSLMILELSNSMQMKRLHALAPPETKYRKLSDISVRKVIQPDGSEEDVLGLIWFGSGPGILLEERFVTAHENNTHERSLRHVSVRSGRYARLTSYDDGRTWLISNTGADVFWIVHNENVVAGRWEASATWVEVSNGIPINAVGATDSTVCIRHQDGELEFLASE